MPLATKPAIQTGSYRGGKPPIDIRALVRGLRKFGLFLPNDTDVKNLIERLWVACHARSDAEERAAKRGDPTLFSAEPDAGDRVRWRALADAQAAASGLPSRGSAGADFGTLGSSKNRVKALAEMQARNSGLPTKDDSPGGADLFDLLGDATPAEKALRTKRRRLADKLARNSFLPRRGE